jgi:hypothetical protein
MTKLEYLQEIKDSAIRLQETLTGSDLESIRVAEDAWHRLVDLFYRENEHMMATTKYTTAKEDWGYFVMLVDFAIAFYRDQDEEKSEREV